MCKNTRSETYDPKTRQYDPKFRIIDPILRFWIGYLGKKIGFSNWIRVGIFQKWQRTRSENPVIRSENPESDPRTRWSDPKISDRIRNTIPPIRNFRIGSDIRHWTPLVVGFSHFGLQWYSINVQVSNIPTIVFLKKYTYNCLLKEVQRYVWVYYL